MKMLWLATTLLTAGALFAAQTTPVAKAHASATAIPSYKELKYPPLKPIKMSAELTQELTTRMRKLTRELLGHREATIRVNNDYQSGICWTSIV